MSGIYIPGMAMPEYCYDCPMENGENGMCNLTKKSVYCDRPHWCPLITIPDNGRLIDGDELVRQICGNRWVDKILTASKEELRTALINLPLMINNAKAIIPAYGGENDG